MRLFDLFRRTDKAWKPSGIRYSFRGTDEKLQAAAAIRRERAARLQKDAAQISSGQERSALHLVEKQR